MLSVDHDVLYSCVIIKVFYLVLQNLQVICTSISQWYFLQYPKGSQIVRIRHLLLNSLIIIFYLFRWKELRACLITSFCNLLVPRENHWQWRIPRSTSSSQSSYWNRSGEDIKLHLSFSLLSDVLHFLRIFLYFISIVDCHYLCPYLKGW